jgi:hypothetical protein
MVVSISFLNVTLFLIVLTQPTKLNQNGGVTKGAKVKNELAIHSVPFDHSLEKIILINIKGWADVGASD